MRSALLLAMCASLGIAAETGQDAELKAFESAAALAQKLMEWSLVLVGASLLPLFSTTYRRPRSLAMRLSFLTFTIPWAFTALSVKHGLDVQGEYIARLMRQNLTPDERLEMIASLNDSAGSQIGHLENALLFFGMWLLIFAFWWVFGKTEDVEGTK